MNLNRQLQLPPRTLTGTGKILEVQNISRMFDTKGLIILSRSFTHHRHYASLQAALSRDCIFFQHDKGEPCLSHIRNILSLIREHNIGWIAGIGGGSVIDLAKASAGLSHSLHDPEYYMQGNPPERPGIPFVAVPTTAGSGAEASINAVIIDDRSGEKKSIRDTSFMAHTVILDPETLPGSPPEVIAHSGLDAVTQAIESYFSLNATWLTDTLALKGFELLIRNLDLAYDQAVSPQHKASMDAYESILTGSFLVGIAFTNSRLGVVHGIAHPLGSLYHVPHGQVCALALVPALEINRPIVSQKYDILSSIAGQDLIEKVSDMIGRFRIINVFSGKEIIEPERIISYTLSSGSTAANPKTITREDVKYLLNKIFL